MSVPFRLPAATWPSVLLLALMLAGCAGRGADWPDLAPRPGEVSPMVPRNVAGTLRCPQAECAPPAEPVADAAPDLPPLPPPPARAEAEAELTSLSAEVARIAITAADLRAHRDALRVAALTEAANSPAAAELEVAQSALDAALAPLAVLDYRRAALAVALEQSPDAAALAPRLADLADAIAALMNQ